MKEIDKQIPCGTVKPPNVLLLKVWQGIELFMIVAFFAVTFIVKLRLSWLLTPLRLVARLALNLIEIKLSAFSLYFLESPFSLFIFHDMLNS